MKQVSILLMTMTISMIVTSLSAGIPAIPIPPCMKEKVQGKVESAFEPTGIIVTYHLPGSQISGVIDRSVAQGEKPLVKTGIIITIPLPHVRPRESFKDKPDFGNDF